MNKPLSAAAAAVFAVVLSSCVSIGTPEAEKGSGSPSSPQSSSAASQPSPEPMPPPSSTSTQQSGPEDSATRTPDSGQQTSSAPNQTSPSTDPVPQELDAPATRQQASPGEQLRSNAALGSTMTPVTMHDYLQVSLESVDSYWTNILIGAGYPEPWVYFYFPAPGEVYSTACAETDDTSMFYCPPDDTIAFSQQTATDLWNGLYRANTDPETGVRSGDFSVAFFIAHEYAHNVQSELGIAPSTAAPVRKYPVYKTELHADCWAGVWANSAYYQGALQAGDVEEAQQATILTGDYAFTEEQHHGTPQQRVDAFTMGYNYGTPSVCDTWLLSDY